MIAKATFGAAFGVFCEIMNYSSKYFYNFAKYN